jgi:hypothetical protein
VKAIEIERPRTHQLTTREATNRLACLCKQCERRERERQRAKVAEQVSESVMLGVLRQRFPTPKINKSILSISLLVYLRRCKRIHSKIIWSISWTSLLLLVCAVVFTICKHHFFLEKY